MCAPSGNRERTDEPAGMESERSTLCLQMLCAVAPGCGLQMSIKTHLLQHLSWKWDKNSFGGDVSFRRLFSKRVLSLGFVTFHFSFLLFVPCTSSAAVADCPGGAATLQSLLLVVTLLCPW